MRGKNQRTNLLFFALCLALVASSASCQRAQTASEPENVIVFEGTLEKLGPNAQFVSGWAAAFRLAKYRIERICAGKFDGKEIVVDHIVFDLKQFEGFKVGDRVCVKATISNKIPSRHNEEGIRNPSETITTFYVASDKITRADESGRCCAAAR